MTDISEKKLADRINFYVINLDRAVDRMEQIEKDFAAFPIPRTRVPAIEGKKLTIPVKDYNAPMYFFYIGKEASPGEIGCYISHLKVLRMFLESEQEFALICEDDVSPTPECYEAIEQAIVHSKTWDLLRLCCHHKTSKTSFSYRSLAPTVHSLCTSIVGMGGAMAYMVNRRAACILVQKLAPMTSQYDDALFQGRIGVREATVVPNCMFLNGHDAFTTRGDDNKRRLHPWHFVYWTCRIHRLWVRIVRYSLQGFRVFSRRFFNR